jgi:uncharacterized protein YdeI (YjbR/CyaY-like superfamily)
MPAEPPLNSVHPGSRALWRAWLMEHHNRTEGVWVIRNRKAADGTGVSVDDLVEEALCFGWIDSLPRKLDETRTMLYFAPRKRGSNWSALNRRRAERMIAEGWMSAAGMEKILAAQADGSWFALNDVDALVTPPDLAEALEARPPAREHFDAFPVSVKRGILEWILNAKRPETRQKRVQETAELARENVRANQWRRAK